MVVEVATLEGDDAASVADEILNGNFIHSSYFYLSSTPLDSIWGKPKL